MNCTASECTGKHYSLGYCLRHYRRLQKRGTIEDRPGDKVDVKARIRCSIEIPIGVGCWLWTGGELYRGYGRLSISNRNKMAHVASYNEYIGPVPRGLILDHLCRTRRCVNPEHLEPVTRGVNTMRSKLTVARINADKTHCKRGHEFTEENTQLFRQSRGGRIGRNCRKCRALRSRKR